MPATVSRSLLSPQKSALAAALDAVLRHGDGFQTWGGLRWGRIIGLRGGVQARLRARALGATCPAALVEERGDGNHAWQPAGGTRCLSGRLGLVACVQHAGVDGTRLPCGGIQGHA